MRAIAVVIAIAIAACKTDPPAPSGGSGGSSTSTSTSTSTSKSPSPNVMPTLPGDPLLPVKPTADGAQLHATWCIAAPDFSTAIKAVNAALEGWSNVATRGEAPTAGISADRDDHHVGIVVTALRAGPCAEPGHYRATVTLTRP
jgi:hypothetical protein